MKKTVKILTDQLGFDYNASKWPDQEKFPLNIDDTGREVGKILENDLLNSNECLIITGFTSLSQLVEWFGTTKFNNLKRIRILLGNDPILRKRSKYPFNFVELDLREYWINKGISLYLGSSVLSIIDKLQRGKINIKFTKRSHAKIYVSDRHITMGSSNFSNQGLVLQQEANIRKPESDDYNDIRKIAENFYDEGRPYNQDLENLLKQLLADVTWQEALARAIAEVLEGKWFSANNDFFDKLNLKKFWPTQFQGLIESINILIDKSNVLIADPTGSGKTKMCSAIMISFIYWLWQTGDKFKSNLLLFSPPVVRSNWENELRELDFLSYKLRSLGILSNTTEDNLKDILKELYMSNVLVIDEAHNLLNPLSNRSRNLSNNNADYKILITATPVNKKLDDLIRIIELLDIDNLSDSDFNHYKSIKEDKVREVKSEDRERLKSFIDNFLVRRTKAELNTIIDKDRDSYKNKGGKNCRFPNVDNQSYPTKETVEDRAIVTEISDCAKKLKGLNYLQKFEPQKYFIRTSEDRKRYINQRIEGAKNLSIYNIRACLRSSRVALLEYILGTEKIDSEYGLQTTKEYSGHIINTIRGLSSKPPELKFKSSHFPIWLTDIDEFKSTCQEEISVLEKILGLAKKLSTKREEGKVEVIIKLLEKNNIVIAFDSKLITLDFLNKLLHERKEVKSFIATGSNKAILEKVLRICSPGTLHTDTVIFCSDMMSEGVNLQGASSLILLDLPSVVRLVEQRIGRIDRMDTDHESIDVFWPNDSDEYSLKGDKRLINTSVFLNATIGGNFNIPAELMDKHFENVDSVESIQKELEEKKGEKGWEGSSNFFKPIEQLKTKFISDEVYEFVKDIQSQIKARVSFYKSDESWCFIATKGSIKESPKWIFLQKKKKPLYNFIEVSAKLNSYLPLIEDDRLKWDQDVLNSFLREFRDQEKFILPEKKRRALDVAEYILKEKLLRMDKVKDNETKRLLRHNLSLFNTSIKDEITDLYSLAELWLEVLQPYLNKKRDIQRNRRKAFNLDSLKDDWKRIQLSDTKLKDILNNCHKSESIDHKIAACIIGVAK